MQSKIGEQQENKTKKMWEKLFPRALVVICKRCIEHLVCKLSKFKIYYFPIDLVLLISKLFPIANKFNGNDIPFELIEVWLWMVIVSSLSFDSLFMCKMLRSL